MNLSVVEYFSDEDGFISKSSETPLSDRIFQKIKPGLLMGNNETLEESKQVFSNVKNKSHAESD